MKYKIALILNADRQLNTYPSVYNTANLLLKNGFDVSLFIPEHIESGFDNWGVEIVRFKKTRPVVIGIFKTLFSQAKKYDLFIAFHSEELIATGLIGTIFRIPYIYFCLEIIDHDQIKTIKSRIKKSAEIFFNNKSVFTIVQDENRKNLIMSANNIDKNKILCVPNSYIGIIKEKTNYLRDKFNIPKGKIIVLYTGGIESWALDRMLIESTFEWGNEYVLVLHGWSRDGYLRILEPYIDKINATEKKIYLSLDSLREKEYANLVTSADIGLVWYKRNLSNNVARLGLSSGKLAMFLRCGLPIVVPSYLEGISEFINKYQFGILADNESEIKKAVASIMENYQLYRNNAFRFCSDFLDFEKKFINVLNKIQVFLSKS